LIVVVTASDGLEFARKLHSEGRNEDALQAVNMAIDRKDDADARVLRGFIKEALGDKEGALEDYNVAAASDPAAANKAPAKGAAAPVDLGAGDGSNLSDSYADCKGWGFMCTHADKKDWMQEYCPLTCHLVLTGQQMPGGGFQPQEIPDHLRDKYSECTGWASVCEVPDRTTWMYKNCPRTCFQQNPCLQTGTCDFGKAGQKEKRKQTHDSLSQFEGDTQEPEEQEDDYYYGDPEPADYALFQKWQEWSHGFNENGASSYSVQKWDAKTAKRATTYSGWEPVTAPSDKEALLKIYWATNGPKWGSSLNWGCGDPCREMWWGVVCKYDKETHSLAVVELRLERNGLKGAFPDEITLPHLRVLDVTENTALKGVFPELPALERLLSQGALLSISSQSLAKSTKMIEIRAGHNLLNGTLADLTPLTDLEVLDFRGSWEGLVGKVPASIGDFKKLKELDLSECLLHGELPESLGDLPDLEELYFARAEIEGPVPSGLMSHPKLKKLDLTRNFLRGAIPKPKGAGPYPLQLMRMSYNKLHAEPGTLQALFESHPEVYEVNLANNPLNSELPSLESLKKAKSILLYGARLFGKVPVIHNLPKLNVLELHSNFISGPIPVDWFDKKTDDGGKRSLQVVRMYNNQITGKLPEEWGAVAQTLLRVDLHSNKLKGGVPAMLSRLPRIREVRLDDNLLSGPLPLGPNYAWILPYQSKPKTHRSRMHTFNIDSNNFDEALTPGQQKMYDSKIRRFAADGYKNDDATNSTYRICDTRIELYGEVLANETLKWKEVTEINNWLMAFDACFNKPVKYRHMKKAQKIGEMPKLDLISDKGKFASHMERFRRKFPKEYSFIPVSFIIPSQLADLKVAMDGDEKGLAPTTNDGMAYWLIKPRASCCGRGIRLVNTYAEVPQDKKGQYAGHIAQRFMSNPYPIVGYNPEGEPGGYKLIIRLFVIVTTFEPMSVFVVPDGPMFYTRRPHSLKSKAWKDRASFITDYFFTHAQADLGTTLSRLRNNYMRDTRGDDDTEIWRKIKHATVKTLIPLSERLAQQEKELLPYERSSYHIFGYDISVNNHTDPVVIEVNAHPMTDLEIVKTNETARKPVVKQDRELKMDMVDRLASVLGLFDRDPNSATVKQVKENVQLKAKQFGWEKCDEEVGVLIPKRNGKPCLTPQALRDIEWSELEMIRKGPLEAAFPLENGRNLLHLFEGKAPRTEVVVEWWEETKALGGEHAKCLERIPAYIAPAVDKKFERDRY